MGANSVKPDQTAPIGVVWSGFTLFVKRLPKHFNRQQKQALILLLWEHLKSTEIYAKNEPNKI